MYFNLKLHQTSDFYSKSWQAKKTKKIAVPEGHLDIESSSHYIAHIDLISLQLDVDARINLHLPRPAYLMLVSFEKNSCRLLFQPPGDYYIEVPPGVSKLMLVNFRPEWLIHKCSHLPELEAFASCIERTSTQHQMLLPSFSIGKSLFNMLNKVSQQKDLTRIDTDRYLFINSCVNKYYNKFKAQRNLSSYHQEKAKAIAQFVSENYANSVVEDLPKLAQHFMTSERNLARLARMTFGVPLHKQVIKLRMGYGLHHLFTSDLRINEISKMIGYSEPCYFSKAFKKHFGVSPRWMVKR